MRTISAIPYRSQENKHNFYDKSIFFRLTLESHCFHGHV